jgi:asparagine synthetase B (glutamine-hydrolysing)
MVEVDRDALELVLQTGGEVKKPLFRNTELYNTDQMRGLVLGKYMHGLDYDELRQHLELAVIDAIGDKEKVALLLSGGVDSSLLGRLIRDTCPDTDITAYHTVFGVPERDEFHFAEAAAKHIGVPMKIIHCEPLAQIPIILEALRKVKTPSYSVGTVYKAMKAIELDGFDVVVNALGLDELMAGYTSHRRFFQRRWLPTILPFRKTSSSTYRKLSIMLGNTKAFVLNLMLLYPSLNLVKDSSVDPNELYGMMKENNTWNTLQRMTLNAMIDHFATLMWRGAEACNVEIIFPYINKDLMSYCLNLHPSVKINKAPIRHLMRTVYKMPEINCANGEQWNKIGWGGVYEPYFDCENFLKAIDVPDFKDFHEYFNKDYDLVAGRNRVSLQVSLFLKILELNG